MLNFKNLNILNILKDLRDNYRKKTLFKLITVNA